MLAQIQAQPKLQHDEQEMNPRFLLPDRHSINLGGNGDRY
jgi:hypothetical protein